MANPFRNFRLHYHRIRNTPTVELDGLRIHAGKDRVPKFVRNVLYKGHYEDAERALLTSCVKPGDRVLEIGCGIGVVAMLANRLAGPGNVTSYEANTDLRSLIEANFALNGLVPNLRMRAITVDGAAVTFHRSDNVVSSSLYDRAEGQQEVTVESDALFDVLEELRPNTVIMDVEGAEIDLLAEGALKGVESLLVELHPHIVGQEKIDALLASLETRGFVVTADREKNVLLKRMMP